MTMDPQDWEAEEPSPDFVERVMSRLPAQSDSRSRAWTRRRTLLGAGLVGGLALAAGVALAVGQTGGRWSPRGSAIASHRQEVHLGSRAIAVLERGAEVKWNGDDVDQPAGDVFYRVESGGAFRVHTAAGDVQVLGTCFRVRVEKAEEPMNGRDLKVGAIGAALSAAAFVSVYEGRVSLSHASERVTLTAGESARADGLGVARSGGSGALAGNEASAAAGGRDEPLLAANANLADSVREYKQRLEAIEAQKGAIAKQLEDAQRRLAIAENDGQVPVKKSEYDLSQDDWKQLAKEGAVVAKMACAEPDSWNVSAQTLDAAGLAPEDARPIHDALQQSAQRIWAVLRPLCISALQGNAQMADKLGSSVCRQLVGDVARKTENTDQETTLVAEIRAGITPFPKDPSALGSFGQMLYAMSGESTAMERDIAQSIGPDAAHNFVFGERGHFCSSRWATPSKTPRQAR